MDNINKEMIKEAIKDMLKNGEIKLEVEIYRESGWGKNLELNIEIDGVKQTLSSCTIEYNE